jgi:hypothetical protein
LYFVYLNESNNIEKVKKDKYFLTSSIISNTITKDELFKIILKNKVLENEQYKLNFLFKYNFTIDTNNIISFLKNFSNIDDEQFKKNYYYLTPITSISNVEFKKTITMFHDLNSITIIYRKSSSVLSKNNDLHTHSNKTKKLYIKKTSKRTNRLYI